MFSACNVRFKHIQNTSLIENLFIAYPTLIPVNFLFQYRNNISFIAPFISQIENAWPDFDFISYSMYTEESILRYGKYRSYRLADVPKEYLYQVFVSKIFPDKAFVEYLETNKERFGFFIEKKSGKAPQPRKKKWTCDKVAYPTEQWARQAIDLIQRHPRGPKRGRRRCYYCEHCGLWHLTSMSLEAWQTGLFGRRVPGSR